VGLSILSLDQSHDLKSFNCGNDALNNWLQNTSRQHQKKNISRTSVLIRDESPTTIIGYYALAIRGLTLKEALPKSMKKSLPINVPAMTLARLAVSLQEQGKGHGERLLLDAMEQVKTASSLIGGSHLFVDAKGTELAGFYSRYGFVALPDNPLTLCLPIASIP
jgi:predicted GNAT family N-acyltransferase